VSCGADQIVRIFARTAEPLVLEDEREEEKQQEDESALVTGQDTVVPGQAGHSLPSRKTIGAERAVSAYSLVFNHMLVLFQLD
jgi:U3 small nucleolar RNA-associated protein 12